jgi:hypothetical protein
LLKSADYPGTDDEFKRLDIATEMMHRIDMIPGFLLGISFLSRLRSTTLKNSVGTTHATGARKILKFKERLSELTLKQTFGVAQ